MGGRGSGSRMSGTRRGSSTGGAGGASAASIGGMSRDERTKYLQEAPVGTKIEGLVSTSGRPVDIEKVREYSRVMGAPAGGFSVPREVWQVNGVTDPYIARTLRTAYEGTNRHYRTRR